jgi:exopolysaccharide production protein ExoZ
MLYSVHFLRFVAASGVVIHHSGLLAPFHNIMIGAAGVDIFFVISGVVIGTSTKPDMRVRDFIGRRLLRIYPLYWIATAAWIASKALHNDPLPGVPDLIYSLLLVPPNLSSEWYPTYFAGWTLTFELLFYAVFAACMFTGRPRLVCAVALVGLAFALHDPGNGAYLHSLAMLLVEFVAGLAIALAIGRGLMPGRTAGLLLITLALVLFASDAIPPFTWPRQIAWGVPSALLVYGMLAFEPDRFLRNPLIVLGGDASYAIYLCHMTVGNLVSVAMFRSGFPSPDYPSLWALVLIPSSLMAGAFIYRVVDRPLLTALRAFSRRDHRIRVTIAR